MDIGLVFLKILREMGVKLTANLMRFYASVI